MAMAVQSLAIINLDLDLDQTLISAGVLESRLLYSASKRTFSCSRASSFFRDSFPLRLEPSFSWFSVSTSVSF